ncbi:MAG TPA: hypothetical protein VFV81_04705 [Verrucomicrobiae bacterium]|nr:hypothetical protein [Verrucomicrobiae bacterium]
MRSWYWMILTFLLPMACPADPPVYQGQGLCRFVLHDYYLPVENEYKIDNIVADLLRRHEELFAFTNSDLRITIRIFGRFNDYAAFARTKFNRFEGVQLSGNISNLAGYFSSMDNEVVTWRQRDPTYLANNILHECSHAIMHQEYRDLPLWLDEGCAVYFSFPAFMRSTNAEERLEYQWFELKKWLDARSLPNLRQFVNLTPAEFRRMDPAQSYPLSWSLFQFLAGTPQNRACLRRVASRFQEQDPFHHDCAALLDQSYPGGLAKMEQDWHRWIAVGATNVLGARLNPPSP